MFRPLTLSAALVAAFTFAGPALAASDLAVELKQLARAEQGKVSLALSNISYNDALYLLDELNPRRLPPSVTGDGQWPDCTCPETSAMHWK